MTVVVGRVLAVMPIAWFGMASTRVAAMPAFAFGAESRPRSLVAAAGTTANGVPSGASSDRARPSLNAATYNPNAMTPAAVGSAALTFADGDNATFVHAINGFFRSMPVTRQIFAHRKRPSGNC